MNGYRIAALVLALAGLGTLGYAVASGQMQIAFVLFFPVVYGSGSLGLLGILLIFLAFILWGLGTMAKVREMAGEQQAYGAEQGQGIPAREEMNREWVQHERRTHGGGLVMIGPIPIVFGSSGGVVKTLMILAIVLIGLWILGALLLRG